MSESRIFLSEFVRFKMNYINKTLLPAHAIWKKQKNENLHDFKYSLEITKSLEISNFKYFSFSRNN